MTKKIFKFSWLDLIKSILYLAGDKKRPFIIWSIVLFFTYTYLIVPPLIIGKVVDFFTNYNKGDSLNLFYFYVIFLGGFMVTFVLFRLAVRKHLNNLRTDIIYNLRVKGFEKLIAQSLDKHTSESVGAKAQKIQTGSELLLDFVRTVFNNIFETAASLLGITIVFAFLSAKYIIFLLVYVFIFFIILKIFRNKLEYVNYEKNKAMESASGSYIEGLNNVLTVKSSGAERSFRGHVANKEEVTKNYTYETNRIIINQWRAFRIFSGFFAALFLYMTGMDAIAGSITVGYIVIFFSYLERVIANAQSILRIYEQLISAKTAFARMMPIFWTKRINVAGDQQFPIDWDKIKIRNGEFFYKQDGKKDKIAGVHKLNIVINKFQKIGLVGRTGSGKSTCAKLLIGLYPLQTGEYKIGSENFYKIQNEEILKNISIVLQESEMFNLTLKENITLMRHFDTEKFIKAIKIAQLEEVIAKLPQGINTLIGERGYHLSGGERQRVGIARAIYKDPQIIIFDEATSSVDTKTESLIQKALESKLKRKTLIFIAHRVTTLRNVDLIYVFNKGRIVEQGKYSQLVNNSNSIFSKFYKN